MAKDRYRYDAKGALKGFSSDQSPFKRACTGIAILLGVVVVVGVFGSAAGDLKPVASDNAETLQMSNDATGEVDQSIAEAPTSLVTEDPSQGTSEVPATPVVDIQGAVQAAMQDAFARGDPVRWKANDDEGYAVPSAVDGVGCRNVYYSVDSRAGWQSPTTTVCP